MLQFLVLRRCRKLARTLFRCRELFHLSPEARERGVAIRRRHSLQRSSLPTIFTTIIKKLTFGFFSLKNRLVPEKNHTLKFKSDKKYFFLYIHKFVLNVYSNTRSCCCNLDFVIIIYLFLTCSIPVKNNKDSSITLRCC